MAILRRQFSSSDLGMGIENWYYLARDTETGRIFVYHEWSRRRGETYEGGSEDIELDSFLHHAGTAQDHLRRVDRWLDLADSGRGSNAGPTRLDLETKTRRLDVSAPRGLSYEVAWRERVHRRAR